jgi:hypothetical protein
MYQITKQTKLPDIESAIASGITEFETVAKLTPQAIELLHDNKCRVFFKGKELKGYYFEFLWTYLPKPLQSFWINGRNGKQGYFEHLAIKLNNNETTR